MSRLGLLCALLSVGAVQFTVQQQCENGEELVVPKDIADLKKVCLGGLFEVSACLYGGGADIGGLEVPVNTEVTEAGFTYGCAYKDEEIIPYVTTPLGPLSRFVKKLYRRRRQVPLR